MKSHLGVSAFAETYTYVFNRRGFNLEKSFMLLSSVFFVFGGGGGQVAFLKFQFKFLRMGG